jgi:hypothetical protein
MERGFGQHPAAAGAGFAAWPGEQPVQPVGLGDDAASLGLVLSGLVVRLGETLAPRDVALILPFLVAGVGTILLSWVVWRAIPRGFASI